MRSNIRLSLSIAIAIATGLIILAGYLVPNPLLQNIQVVFLRWGAILAAVALLVGVANLARVHSKKLVTGQRGAGYSLVLLLSLGLTIVVAALLGPTSSWAAWLFNNIQRPVESSLMSILAVTLALAAARLLRRRLNLFTGIFLATVILALISRATLPGLDIPALSEAAGWIDWLVRTPAVAGARGILLGVALGTVATGLRVLLGADRPYED